MYCLCRWRSMMYRSPPDYSIVRLPSQLYCPLFITDPRGYRAYSYPLLFPARAHEVKEYLLEIQRTTTDDAYVLGAQCRRSLSRRVGYETSQATALDHPGYIHLRLPVHPERLPALEERVFFVKTEELAV